MILKTFLKQPSEFKDYDVDYSPWLNPMGDVLDVIDTKVTCLDDELDTSLKVVRHAITSHLVKLWVEGGTTDYAYKVEIKVTTVGGRLDESELIFAVAEF